MEESHHRDGAGFEHQCAAHSVWELGGFEHTSGPRSACAFATTA